MDAEAKRQLDQLVADIGTAVSVRGVFEPKVMGPAALVIYSDLAPGFYGDTPRSGREGVFHVLTELRRKGNLRVRSVQDELRRFDVTLRCGLDVSIFPLATGKASADT